MSIIIVILIFVSVSSLMFFLVRKNKEKNNISWVKFYAKGKEAGFSSANINLLKRLALHSGIAHPAALFWSQVQMDNCIKNFIQDVKQKKTEFLPDNQEFLAKLYDFRKKMEMNRPIYRNGIVSSRYIDELQTVQVVISDVGVFKSKVISNKGDIISIERPDSSALPVNFNWKQKHLLVYFWRKNDSGYCFETNVVDEIFTNDPPVLTISHSDKLIRTQSRKTLRIKTHRAAMLYSVEDGAVSSKPKVMPGIKCYLEDISDCGCAVTAEGRAPAGLRIIVQFVIDKTPLSISGVIRGVDYNDEKKTSLLHIESDLIPMSVKNKIYGVMFGMVVDDIDIISVESGDTEYTDKKTRPEIPSDGDDGAVTENGHAFDDRDSSLSEKYENKSQEYDYHHIEDIINWDDKSKIEDNGK